MEKNWPELIFSTNQLPQFFSTNQLPKFIIAAGMRQPPILAKETPYQLMVVLYLTRIIHKVGFGTKNDVTFLSIMKQNPLFLFFLGQPKSILIVYLKRFCETVCLSWLALPLHNYSGETLLLFAGNFYC